MRLQGQVALVTGGSTGIGAAVCRAFGAEGARVVVNYRAHPEEAETVARESNGIAVKADVSHEHEVRAMFDRVIEECGRIDILVANAGIQKDSSVEDMTLEAWELVLQVNLTGQFLCAREAVRRFVAQGDSPVSPAIGKIICMSSVHELIPWTGHINYAASKGGVMLMMKTLAQEVAGRRIRVNSIAPGAIETPINWRNLAEPRAREKLLQVIPYGRLGKPEDVARVAVWLASDDSDYVTGTTIFVDGGMSLYPGFIGNG